MPFPPPGELPDQGANLSLLCSCIECGFVTTGPWLDQDGAPNPTWATLVLSGGFGPEKRRVREKTRQRVGCSSILALLGLPGAPAFSGKQCQGLSSPLLEGLV